MAALPAVAHNDTMTYGFIFKSGFGFYEQFCEKIILDRLVKNAQMQGARNPED